MSVSRKKWRDRGVTAAVCGVAAVLGAGCGGGGGGGGGHPLDADAAAEASTVLHRGDGGSEDAAAGDTGATKAYDGTVGMACKSDVDCQPAGGPGVNTCSLTTYADPLLPTPVCIQRTCDPGTDGLIHFCDGPDVSSSPGICLPVPNGGVCLPSCFFGNDGAAPVGCKGNDTCVYYAAEVSTTGVPVGLGYCFGGCVTSADCPTGSTCQTDSATCVVSATTPTKAIGQSCTSADNGSTTTPAACNCFLGGTSTTGLCTQTCIVKSTTATCPAGYTCDSLLPAELIGAGDASVTGFSTQNTRLAGYCLPTCGADGGACPGASACSTADTAGPDCLLP